MSELSKNRNKLKRDIYLLKKNIKKNARVNVGLKAAATFKLLTKPILH